MSKEVRERLVTILAPYWDALPVMNTDVVRNCCGSRDNISGVAAGLQIAWPLSPTAWHLIVTNEFTRVRDLVEIAQWADAPVEFWTPTPAGITPEPEPALTPRQRDEVTTIVRECIARIRIVANNTND